MNRMCVLLRVLPALAGTIMLGSCIHDPQLDPLDARLLELARVSEGITWYGGLSTPLPRSAGSGHQEPLLRTRYNATAATVLDQGQMVSMDTLFPEGSLIVKELMTDASTVGSYAIMLKESGNDAADASGWVWGYLRADGTVRIPAYERGASCRSCHTQAGHIDQTLMNIAFP